MLKVALFILVFNLSDGSLVKGMGPGYPDMQSCEIAKQEVMRAAQGLRQKNMGLWAQCVKPKNDDMST